MRATAPSSLHGPGGVVRGLFLPPRRGPVFLPPPGTPPPPPIGHTLPPVRPRLQRLKGLCARHATAPLPALLNPGAAVAKLASIFRDNGTLDRTLPPSATHAICTLALCGWEATTKSATKYLRCPCCCARAQLSATDALAWPHGSAVQSGAAAAVAPVSARPRFPHPLDIALSFDSHIPS